MFLIPTPQLLQKIITGLDDLYTNDISDLDMQGDLYEYMLGKLSTAGQNGQFRTPKHIRQMMVDLIRPTPDDVICERILTVELGSREDYTREYGETPFGLLIRRIAKLDHEVAMEIFSRYINDESLNQRQIVYLKKIIQHVEQNGYMEDPGVLMKPPFDKPVSFIGMFDARTRSELIETIKGIKENAMKVVA